MTGAELINAVGIPSMVAALVYIGAKLNTLDSLKKDVEQNIKPDIKELRGDIGEVGNRLTDVRERLATLEAKTDGLFKSRSPISLTATGKKYLLQSGLQTHINDNQDDLMLQCDHDQTISNPYDVQQVAFEFFDRYEFPDDIDNQVKTYAFNQGVSMDAMRRLAGIYFRDLCLKSRKFR